MYLYNRVAFIGARVSGSRCSEKYSKTNDQKPLLFAPEDVETLKRQSLPQNSLHSISTPSPNKVEHFNTEDEQYLKAYGSQKYTV